MICAGFVPTHSILYQIPMAFIKTRLTVAFAQLPFDLALSVALADAGALIVELLATRHSDFELGAATHEVYLQGDERHALLRDLNPQLDYLLSVEEEFSGPSRLMVEIFSRLLPGRDMYVHQPRLAALDAHIPLCQVHPPRPHALYLRPHEHQARLDGLLDEIVVPDPPVLYSWCAALVLLLLCFSHTRDSI